MSLPRVNFLHLTEFKSPDKILKLMVNMTRSKVKSRSHHDVAHPQSMSLNLLHLFLLRYSLGQNFIWQGHYSKVISRSHHDIAHLQAPTNDPTKYQLPTPYGFQDIGHGHYNKVKSRSHHDVAHLHPPNQCSYQVLTYYTLRFLRYSLDKLFPATRMPIQTCRKYCNFNNPCLKNYFCEITVNKKL